MAKSLPLNMKNVPYWHLLIFSLFFPLMLSAQPTLETGFQKGRFELPAHARYIPGKLIVKIRAAYRSACRADGIGIAQLEELFDRWQVRNTGKVFPRLGPPVSRTNAAGEKLTDLSLIYQLDFDRRLDIAEFIDLLQASPAVEYAEPWYIYEPFYQPNDPFADTLNGAPGMWHLQQIAAQQGWELQRNNGHVTVAIIDTGILFKHEDLMDNIAYNEDDPIDGKDNDQDGYVDNYRGWDFGGKQFGGLGDNDPSIGGSGHGVGVTGVLGATTDNGIGTAGVCFNCKYLPIKGSADDLSGSITHGYQGIIYAVEQGADVINCSWGGTTRSLFGEDVVNYATINRKAAVIAAAGNSESDTRFYPAAYSQVISVANTSLTDTLCCNSTYNYSVDISAPGHGILAPVSDGGYGSLNGTSFAAPVAAGVVAVVKAHFPQYTPFQAAQRVRVTTDNIDEMNPNRIDKLGTGRVNLFRALGDPPKPSVRMLDFSVEDLDGDLRFEGGDTLIIKLDFINYLEPTDELHIEILTPESASQVFVELLDTDFPVGKVEMMQMFNNRNHPFLIRLRENVPVDFDIPLKIVYRDAQHNYQDFEYAEFRVNKSYLNIRVNNFHTTITSSGNFGFNDFGNNHEGIGVVYKDHDNTLFEGGLLLGMAPEQVSDNIRNGSGGQDRDFQAITRTFELRPPTLADFEAIAEFADRAAPNPLGLHVKQHIYAFEDDPHRDYLIFQYTLRNDGSQPLNGLYAGMFADWDISDFSRNACNYDEDEKMVFAYDVLGFNRNFYAISLLSEHNFHAFATTNPSDFTYSDQEKFMAISNTPTFATASAGIISGGADIMNFIGAGPVDIPAGDSVAVAFALLAGQPFSSIEMSSRLAREQYRCNILGEGPAAGFDFSPDSPVTASPVQFTDLNTSGLSWHWDFGDGSSSDEPSPQHVYTLPGTYTVVLTIYDGICEVKSKKTVSVALNTSRPPLLSQPMRIFPNPTASLLQLSWEDSWQGDLRVRLSNLYGQMVKEVGFRKQSGAWAASISLADLSPGVYQLEIRGKGLEVIRKVVRY